MDVTQVAGDLPSSAGVSWIPLVAVVLAGGVAARVLWIAVGLVRLRRLRSAGEAVTPIEDCEELQHRLGTQAEIRFVAGLGQPVTFGLWRPIVLLPDTLRGRAPEILRRRWYVTSSSTCGAVTGCGCSATKWSAPRCGFTRLSGG